MSSFDKWSSYFDTVPQIFSMQLLKHFEVIEVLQRDTTETKLAEKLGYSLIVSGKVDGNTYKVLEVGTIHNGKPYFITYDTEDLYEKYLPIAQKVINTF